METDLPDAGDTWQPSRGGGCNFGSLCLLSRWKFDRVFYAPV